MNATEKSSLIWPKFLACYVFLIFVAVSGVLLMQGLTAAFLHIGALLDASRYVMTVINHFAILILGLLWLVGVIAIEAYLRQGVANGRLWPRMAKIFAWVIGLFILTYVLQSLPL